MPDMLSKIKGQDLIFSVALPRLLLPRRSLVRFQSPAPKEQIEPGTWEF